ncbi:hypothetical protein E2320_012569 [Naja naja]|nr:hypothetical protein E2320_012569 [Naja naja]
MSAAALVSPALPPGPPLPPPASTLPPGAGAAVAAAAAAAESYEEEELESPAEEEDGERSGRARDSDEGTLQEYQKRMKKLDQQYKERIRNAELFLHLETEQVERNYIKEKKAAVKEFEDKKIELKESLIAELEEKKKMIESEKLTMELTGGKAETPAFSKPFHGSEADHDQEIAEEAKRSGAHS